MMRIATVILYFLISSAYAGEVFSDCAANCIKYIYKCYSLNSPNLLISTNSSSIKDIVSNLTENNFSPTPIHGEIEDLSNFNSKCIYIVHLDGIHFSVLEKINGNLTLIDWPNPPFDVTSQI